MLVVLSEVLSRTHQKQNHEIYTHVQIIIDLDLYILGNVYCIYAYEYDEQVSSSRDRKSVV